MRVGSVLLRLAVVATLVCAPVAATPGPLLDPAVAIDASKGRPGFCPNRSGVTVVIDFQELGGKSIVRCAPGTQRTGLTALQNAGFIVTGTQRWGLSFVCRIEGKPGAGSESCVDTPPASAYWSYWHAPNGGKWTYSNWGVKNRKPPQGSFDGWSFSYKKTAKTNPPPRVAATRPGQPIEAPPPRGVQSGGLRDNPNDLGVTNRGAPPAANPATPPAAQKPDREKPPEKEKDKPKPPPSSTPSTPKSSTPATSTAVPVTPGRSANGVPYTGGQGLETRDEGGFPVSAAIGLGTVGTVGAAAAAIALVRKRKLRREQVGDQP